MSRNSVYNYGNNNNKSNSWNNQNKQNQNQTNVERELNSISQEINTELKHPLPFSSFGPQKTTVNLISGRDISYDELRLAAYKAKENNSTSQYESFLRSRKEDTNKCATFIKEDTRKAARYLQIATEKRAENENFTMKPYIPFEAPAMTICSSFGPNTNTQPFQSKGITAFGPKIASVGITDTTTNINKVSPSGTGIFGQTSTKPVFGSTAISTPTFGANNAPKFGQQAFGSQMTSAFGSGAPSKPFGSNNTTPRFGSTAFGNQNKDTSKTTNSSAFGSTTTPTFGSTAFSQKSTSITSSLSPFGSTATSAFDSSSFGNKAGSGAFGSNTTSIPSAFGLPPKPSGVFGASKTDTQTASENKPSPFGPQTTSIFGNGQTTSAFGNKKATTAFGNNQTTSAFGNKQTTTVFGNNQTTSAFGGNTDSKPTLGFGKSKPFGSGTESGNNSSVFGSRIGGALTESPSTQQTQSLFSTKNNFQGVTGNYNTQPRFIQSDKDDSITKLEDLLEAARIEFEGAKFRLGRIPDIPPPRELC